ncbi:cell wall glucanase [Aspergillus eucalypticola CBS 122712]|uniref:Crh-like protein n=1 Tax=Aspergillus eucalypticola (strain CBS 122712 / IBT 29274) TaxID=1448314 RepID=A0A317W782_ASPEC|nr:cell wall glucanase [Aspergillus eucalypticola CBS 122712]PWY80000.1 cell wall glucanase [Aspergillus eucalypticola CBS 122712]
MVRYTSSILLASLAATSVWAASSPPSCSTSSQCPEEYPCCSQYGQCGTGAYCLGGCDPISSYSLDSCVGEPVCQSKTYKWDSLDSAALNTKYLGNASEYDWVYSGYPKLDDGNLLLTMPKNTVGTLFANNHYVWYGKISGKVKSSRGAGVVTAFILLSDVKDEIDFEWIGADLANVQTNYYWQGVLNYNNGDKDAVNGSDTFDDWHEYEIDWKEDAITWSVDGQVKRTLTKESTWNETAKRYQYPQSPSRMQLSLWPAGQASNAPGTIEWAGGEIDWDSQDIKDKGYYYATFSDITVECYDAPNGTVSNGNKSYMFTNKDGLQQSVQITNNDTVLASFGATGLDMDLGASDSSSSGTNGTVPENQGGSGNVPGSSSSSTTSGSSSTSSGFSQGSSTDTSGAPSQNERVMRGSFFAALVAVVVLVAL